MFKNYLDTQFQGISVEPPLFYNAQFGIRFEIGVQYREIDHPGYFESVYIRSTMIFEEIFNEDDEFWVYIKSYKAAAPYVDFKQGVDVFPKFLKNKELLGKVECFKTEANIDEDDGDLNGYTYHCCLLLRRQKLNYKGLLKAIGNQDFSIKPYVTDEVFFIDPRKHIIYYLYDDRGLDVISNNKEALLPLYKKFNSWILDYDSASIDKIFNP